MNKTEKDELKLMIRNQLTLQDMENTKYIIRHRAQAFRFKWLMFVVGVGFMLVSIIMGIVGHRDFMLANFVISQIWMVSSIVYR
jgi:hypothetical protein